ncbi:GH22540 [Drosophila grimshawi]|uniref:GH22540 n=1 Tax=Drosophila grimshawi TaxID=7222 RepID=B4K0S4_DROGR|nr:GH22540 [Drosophila grimshawi]
MVWNDSRYFFQASSRCCGTDSSQVIYIERRFNDCSTDWILSSTQICQIMQAAYG